MERFRQVGVDTVCFFPGNTANSLGQPYSQYPPVWRWYGGYDFGSLDRQVADLKQLGMEKLLCIVDLNSPEWLSRQLSLAHESGDSFTHLTECLANPRWKEATMDYLRDFLRYCEEHHSDVIGAYVLACGHTDEWFDHNGEICGLHKERAYRQWRQERGLAEAPPPSALKMNSPDYDQLLFDPACSAEVLHYRRFCNELVGEAICNFAATAREIIRPQAEIGVFYGYVMTRLGAAESGHLAYTRVVNCPDIDFLISPGSYGDRAMGGGGGWLGCSGTEKLAGKIHMHECDQRTHTHNRALTEYVSLHVPHWENTSEDLAGIRREFALALTKRSSLWWFDMWGGFYQEEPLFQCFQQMRQLYDRAMEIPPVAMEEVALIIDPDGLYYFDQRSQRQRAFQPNVRKALNRLGAPFEAWCLEDIPKIPNLEQIKFFIFPCQWEITPEKATLLQEYVLKQGRVVLWLYAPGLSDGKSLDEARIARWTGVTPTATADEDCPRPAIFQHDGWTSAFLRRPEELTPAILKDLARRAGVHIYTDWEVPVYADGHFLAIHTKDGGKMTINLPQECQHVTELYTGKTIPVNDRYFQWEFQSPDTALFQLD